MADDDTHPNAEGALEAQGFAVFPQIVGIEPLCRLRADLETLYRARRAVQRRNGIADGMEGTCHHLLGEGSSMDDFIATLPLHETISRFFEGPYILNSFGGFINRPDGANGYIGAIHRDVRRYSADFRLMINMLIMLDDFTPENGATFLLPGSHRVVAKPSEESFRAKAVRAQGRAGDILLFDSRLWHAAGQNRSVAPRRALTLTFTRPFFKPQLDYPRYLGEAYAAKLPAAVRQVLGYDARVPDTIDAFYQPPERRAYKPDQG